MKRLLPLSLLLLFSSTSFASSQAIYWQKLMLEEKVQTKINNSLATVLNSNQFLVDVEAEVDEPQAPNFGDSKNSGPRVSDANLEDSRGDYIAFSKVGLEVPVLEKYFDQEKTKLMNLYRFNEAYDVFKNLQTVKVTVFLSESLPAPMVDIAEKVVRSTRLSLGTVKPLFKFDKLTLEWEDPEKKKALEAAKKAEEAKKNQSKKKEEPQEPKIWKKDWFEWASRWGNAVGLIFSALILTFLAITLFRRWKEFMESMKPKENPEQQAKDQDKSLDKKKEDEEESEEEMDMGDNGFERFKVCLTQYPIEASNVSREWIVQGSEESRLALRAVAQQLTSDEFANLLGSLGQDQRELWKSVIGAYLTPQELKEANKIIARDVLRALLVPSRVKDAGLLNMLMELGASKITKFLEKNESHAGVLMNLLTPSVTGSILTQVSDQKAEAWLSSAAMFDITTIESAAAELKKALSDFKQSLAPSHFNSRLAELILTSPPSKERMLFNSIAKSSGAEEVVRVAQRLFPSELLLDLPGTFLKETLQAYPMAKRLELLLSREESDRSKLLNSFAEEGSTAREMMTMEMESISNDAGRLSNIQGRSEEIWREYVQFSRQSLERAPNYRLDAEKLIQDWAKTLGKGLKMVNSNAAA